MTEKKNIKINENTIETISEKLHIPDISNKTEWTSIELVDIINHFRKIEGKKTILKHHNLLSIIRNEFSEDINALNFKAVNYQDKKGEQRPMFNLSNSQAKQVLVRESKEVRRAVIQLLEYLEKNHENNFNLLEMDEKELHLHEIRIIVETVNKMADLIKANNDLIYKKIICQKIINLIKASRTNTPISKSEFYDGFYL